MSRPRSEGAGERVELIELENGDLGLTLAPGAGASITSLRLRDGAGSVELMRPTPASAVEEGNPSAMSCFVLMPWSNRIAGARFEFAGREHALRATTPEGHAMHGDVRRRPWRLVTRTAIRAAFTFDSRTADDVNFPFPFRGSISYLLREDALEIELGLTNVGDTDMPAGMGLHPYFPVTLRQADESPRLRAQTGGAYAGLVPEEAAGALRPAHDFSKERDLAATDLDICLTGWTDGAQIRWPRAGVRLDIQASEVFGHLIVFTPPGKPFFAVEPVTHANNGFRLHARGVEGTGVRTLTPGKSLQGQVRFTVSRE